MEYKPSKRWRTNRLMLWILVPFAVLMFGFAFVQVPLFKMFCKSIGINISPLDSAAREGGTGREVRVLFTGVAADKLPVVFKPKQAIQTVEVGTRFNNEYRFVNMSDDSVFFRPVHSVLPEAASKKFTMMKCFCFNDQALGPHESKTFPVISMFSSDLDTTISEVTVNYTLFKKDPREMQRNRVVPNVVPDTTAQTARVP
jgi:cytochrome c oxidase assembly protein subunit 11